MELEEKYLLYLGTGKGWSETLSHIKDNYRLADEMYAICDGDDKLHLSLEACGYRIQQCTNHFVKTSMYYLWMEQYSKHDRMRIKKDISRIISTLKNSVKKHRNDSDFARLKWRIDKTQEELLVIVNELLSKNKDSHAGKFILNKGIKVTLFAELATKGIQIPDTNNHIENLMGIVGQKVKTNHQSWVDANLNIMLNTIWHILS